jgi:hypothetical protein
MSPIRPGRHRAIRGLVAFAVVVAGFVGAMPEALAKYISAASPSNSVTGHTLVAPTLSCSASGSGLLGANVHLTWPATSDSTTVDKYSPANFLTDGYEIDSGTTNGGPYPTVVATVARTATSANDGGPAGGTSYYVIRSTKSLWRSANSNQVTASVQLLSASCN